MNQNFIGKDVEVSVKALTDGKLQLLVNNEIIFQSKKLLVPLNGKAVARAIVEREVGVATGLVTSLKGSGWTTEIQTGELIVTKSADGMQVEMQPNLFRAHSGSNI